MKISALVVDDEQPAREELCYLLSQVEAVEVIGQADNGVAALGLLDDLEPDVVFLDVQMPGLTGFEVARQAGRTAGPATHCVRDGLRSVRAGCIPGECGRLPAQAGRSGQAGPGARPRQEPARAGQGGGRLAPGASRRSWKRWLRGRSRRSQLVVKVDDRILLVQAEDLIYASLNEDEVTVVASQVTGTSNYRTLDELQAQLDQAVFWRVHRSYLVNINKIKEIVPWFSRNFILRMRDAKSTEIPVSRAQTKRLREYLQL